MYYRRDLQSALFRAWWFMALKCEQSQRNNKSILKTLKCDYGERWWDTEKDRGGKKHDEDEKGEKTS